MGYWAPGPVSASSQSEKQSVSFGKFTASLNISGTIGKMHSAHPDCKTWQVSTRSQAGTGPPLTLLRHAFTNLRRAKREPSARCACIH